MSGVFTEQALQAINDSQEYLAEKRRNVKYASFAEGILHELEKTASWLDGEPDYADYATGGAALLGASHALSGGFNAATSPESFLMIDKLGMPIARPMKRMIPRVLTSGMLHGLLGAGLGVGAGLAIRGGMDASNLDVSPEVAAGFGSAGGALLGARQGGLKGLLLGGLSGALTGYGVGSFASKFSSADADLLKEAVAVGSFADDLIRAIAKGGEKGLVTAAKDKGQYKAVMTHLTKNIEKTQSVYDQAAKKIAALPAGKAVEKKVAREMHATSKEIVKMQNNINTLQTARQKAVSVGPPKPVSGMAEKLTTLESKVAAPAATKNKTRRVFENRAAERVANTADGEVATKVKAKVADGEVATKVKAKVADVVVPGNTGVKKSLNKSQFRYKELKQLAEKAELVGDTESVSRLREAMRAEAGIASTRIAQSNRVRGVGGTHAIVDVAAEDARHGGLIKELTSKYKDVKLPGKKPKAKAASTASKAKDKAKAASTASKAKDKAKAASTASKAKDKAEAASTASKAKDKAEAASTAVVPKPEAILTDTTEAIPLKKSRKARKPRGNATFGTKGGSTAYVIQKGSNKPGLSGSGRSSSYTFGNTKAPVLNSAAPGLNSAAPGLNSAAPVLNSAAPGLNSAAPVLNSAAPGLNSAAPVLGTAASKAVPAATAVKAVNATPFDKKKVLIAALAAGVPTGIATAYLAGLDDNGIKINTAHKALAAVAGGAGGNFLAEKYSPENRVAATGLGALTGYGALELLSRQQ